METIKIIEGVNEAIKTLDKASKANASGSITIWRMTDHAKTHLDRQIAELLTHDVCIAGESALAGRCGDPECVCTPKDSAEQRTRIGNTPTELLDPESDEAEALLDAAKEAQTAFWNALHDLEEALGVEIESTQDLQGMTCTDLTSDEDEMEQERRTR